VNLLEGIVALLTEAATKPGVMSLVGIKRVNSCEKDLRVYFDQLWLDLRKLDWGEAKSETGAQSLELDIRRALRSESPFLLRVLSGHIYLALLDGDKVARRQMKEEFKEAGPQAIPPPPGPPPDEPTLYDTILKAIEKIGITGLEAAEYAARRAAMQIKGINDTTLKLLQDAIKRGIEEQLGVEGLGRFIRSELRNMSVYRAKMIANTEMNDAFSEAAIRNMKRLGVEYKQLILAPEACPICTSIKDAGPVPVDQPFVDSDGMEYDRTPIHPNCRCATVGSRPPVEEAPEEEDAATVAN
jgi:hypothetical protein